MELAGHLLPIVQRFKSTVRRHDYWGRLLADSVIGLLVGLIALAYAVSYAALIFSGELFPYLPFGITSALIGTAVVGGLLAAKSSMRLVIVTLSANSVAVLPLVVTPAVRAVRGSGSESDVLPTVMTALGLCTALTGIFLFALGRLGLGRLVRFIPHAVVGGYTAGTGWLIIDGAFKILAGVPLSVDQFSALMQPLPLSRWLPGLAIMLILLLVFSRSRHVIALPAVLIGTGLLFYGCLALTGTSINTARSQGWLFAPISGVQWYEPWRPAALANVHWTALSAASETLLSVPLIAALALLLSTTGSEIATRQDADLDHELAVTGVANVASGLLGGLIGMQVLSLTVLGYNSGARSRAAGMATALLCASMLLLSGSLLSYVPTPILGGLLFYTGIAMLREWLYFGWFRLSHIDYLIVVTILVVMIAVGLLQGVAVGLVIACLVFAFNYSRIPVVKHEVSGADHRSNLVRSFQQERLLTRVGQQLAILFLQGYIFFGTANSLYERVRRLMATREQIKTRFILLDFRIVSGLDTSALRSFSKMKQAAEAHQVQLVFTDCGPVISAQFRQGGILRDNDPVCRSFADLDHGLEWCETQILNAASSSGSSASIFCTARLDRR